MANFKSQYLYENLKKALTIYISHAYRGDLTCHDNKAGRLERIMGNSYGQPIRSDLWKSPDPGMFCPRDHQHPVYGRVAKGDSNGKSIINCFLAMLLRFIPF